MKLIPVILSGGSGTRLWPVSRSAYPKPFMKMPDGQSLLEKTLARARRLTAEQGAVVTVTGRDFYFLSTDVYQRLGAVDPKTARFLLEPVGRNTAPAIAMAAKLVERDFGADACLLVMPADHLIDDDARFAEAVSHAAQLAAAGHLVTFGIVPTRPETGYGYIRTGAAIGDHGKAVVRFIEKPGPELAEQYLATGDYLWNSGMFCFTARTYLRALQATQPKLHSQAEACWRATDTENSPIELDENSFAQMDDISVDYAVMERAAKVAVVPAQFSWSDVGSWQAMSALSESDASGNQVRGKAIMLDAHNCYVQAGERLIAAIGVRDLVIIDTPDALLVADRGRDQDVKTVVEQLRSDNDPAATYHQTVMRPWGSFTILEDAEDCKVKRLVVKPGQILSLQLHHRRSEHWTVVTGTARVRVGEKEFDLRQNESTFIPTETLHRLENPGKQDIALIEVQTGDYFGEDDIVRYEDVYGRS